jgi:hypothetical protein
VADPFRGTLRQPWAWRFLTALRPQKISPSRPGDETWIEEWVWDRPESKSDEPIWALELGEESVGQAPRKGQADASSRKGFRFDWTHSSIHVSGDGRLVRSASVEDLERNAVLAEVVQLEIARVLPVAIGNGNRRMPPDPALNPKLGAAK